MLKNGVTKAIDAVGLRSRVSQIRGWKNNWTYNRQIKADDRRMRLWLASFEKQNVGLHASTEFTGQLPFDFLTIGCETAVEKDVTIWVSPDTGANPLLELKERIFVGRNAYIGVYQPISVGANTIIGAYSYLISGNHRYESRNLPIRDQGYTGAPIVIEDDVWIGTHVVILPGVTIGKGAIIAAGSIVRKDIPPYEIWGGTPAKFLKHRPDA